jgi:Kdo2-lipid IVA lauroyltransferase/acyltransferase
MTTLFRFLSRWPLWALHGLGWLLGWVSFCGSQVYRSRLRHNAALAGISRWQMLGSVGESGKQIAELPRLWMGGAVPVRWDGVAHVERALAVGRGVVFLTPHLGCFEITAQAYAQRFGQSQPITVLFRPPRKAWLMALVSQSRQRDGLLTAPTTLAGVRQLMRALRQGQCVGLLPDQVPGEGQGVWSPFFGQPAYTMTLSARLVLQTGALPLIAWGERLSWGRGYVVHVQPLDAPLSDDLALAAGQVNAAMEGLILQKPTQYLWGYARYKPPQEAH